MSSYLSLSSYFTLLYFTVLYCIIVFINLLIDGKQPHPKHDWESMRDHIQVRQEKREAETEAERETDREREIG